MRGIPWSLEDLEILARDSETGVPRAATAAKLGRTVMAVQSKAAQLGIRLILAEWDTTAAIRARWGLLLPKLKEGLRRDLMRDQA